MGTTTSELLTDSDGVGSTGTLTVLDEKVGVGGTGMLTVIDADALEDAVSDALSVAELLALENESESEVLVPVSVAELELDSEDDGPPGRHFYRQKC